MPEPAVTSSKPQCLREDAIAVLQRLREAGHEAYFAGGCVRDELMGLEPKDYDVATSAPPKTVRALFPKTQAVGQAFGVILVRQRHSTIEVATFRTEFDYQDGRRPSVVKFATAQEDAQRRDFTINGLFLDPLAPRGSQVIDFVGGQDDIKARRLRAIGNAEDRFAEDHLRLLRAVRFAARFGLEIDPATAQAIRAHAPLLKRISPERIADELRNMLTGPSRLLAWRLLWDFALIDTICRFLPPAEAAEYNERRCLFAHLRPEGQISFGLALAAGCLSYRLHAKAAVADVAKLLDHAEIAHIARAMRQALKVSNDELVVLQGTLDGAAMLLHDELRPAKYKRFAARPTAEDSRRLLDAIAKIGQHQDRIAMVLAELDKLRGTVVAPVPLITGDDLTEMGLSPGPIFRRILDAVYDAQLEDRIVDRDAAMALAKSLSGQ